MNTLRQSHQGEILHLQFWVRSWGCDNKGASPSHFHLHHNGRRNLWRVSHMHYNILCICCSIFYRISQGGLIIEFESEFFEELVGCSGFVKHAIFVKIIVALLTSVSLSNALFLASIACVGFLIVLKLKLMLRVATMSFPHTSSYLHQKNYIQQV